MAAPSDNIWGIMRQPASPNVQYNVPPPRPPSPPPPRGPPRGGPSPFDNTDYYEGPAPAFNRQPPPPREPSPKLPPLNQNRPLEGDERIRALEQLLGVAPELAARLRAVERQVSSVEQVASSAAERTSHTAHELQRQVAGLSSSLRQSQGEVEVMKQRLEASERHAAESSSQLQKLQAMMDSEARRSMEDVHRQAQQQGLYIEDEQRRMGAMADDMLRMQRELETVKRESEATKNGMLLAVQRLEAQVGAEAGFVNKLRDAEVDNVNSTAQQFAKINARFVEVQRQLQGALESIQAESSGRKAEVQAVLSKLRSVDTTASDRSGAVASTTLDEMERRAHETEARFRAVEDTLAKQGAALRKESDERLALFGQKDAKDKKTTVERLLVLESTLREVHNTRAAADQSMLQSMEAGHMKLATMVREEKSARETREKKLREQVQQALLKLRAFARDLEEKQEQGRLQLEEVVRMEIKARFKSIDKISQSMREVGRRADDMEARVRRHVDETAAAVRGELYDNVITQVLESEMAHLEIEEHVRGAVDGTVAGLEASMGASVDGLVARIAEIEEDVTDSVKLVQTQVAAQAVQAGQSVEAHRAEMAALHRDLQTSLTETREGVSKDMSELEDVMAAAIKDVRQGIVRERKEIFEALSNQGKETARTVAQLGVHLREGVNKVQGELKGSEAKLTAMVDETRQDMAAQINQNKEEVSGLLETMMEAVDNEITDRKAADDSAESTALARLQEFREEVSGLLQHASVAQEEALLKANELLAHEVQERSTELDRVSKEVSEVRWALSDAAKETGEALVVLEESLNSKAAATELAALRDELQTAVSDTRLGEETLRLEMVEMVESERAETQTAIGTLAEDVMKYVTESADAVAEQADSVTARINALEDHANKRVDAADEQLAALEAAQKAMAVRLEVEASARGEAAEAAAEALAAETAARTKESEASAQGISMLMAVVEKMEEDKATDQAAAQAQLQEALNAEKLAREGAVELLSTAITNVSTDLTTVELTLTSTLEGEVRAQQEGTEAAIAQLAEDMGRLIEESAEAQDGTMVQQTEAVKAQVAILEMGLEQQKVHAMEAVARAASEREAAMAELRAALAAVREEVSTVRAEAGTDLTTAELALTSAADADRLKSEATAADMGALRALVEALERDLRGQLGGQAEQSSNVEALIAQQAESASKETFELQEKIVALEVDLGSHKEGLEAGLAKLADELSELIQGSAEGAAADLEALAERVAAMESDAELQRVALEETLRAEAEARDEKVDELSSLLSDAVAGIDDLTQSHEREAEHREALQVTLRQELLDAQAAWQGRMDAMLPDVVAVRAAVDEFTASRLPDLEALVSAESTQRGEALRALEERMEAGGAARKEQMDSVQSSVLEVTTEIKATLAAESDKGAQLMESVKQQLSEFKAELAAAPPAAPTADQALAPKVAELDMRVIKLEARLEVQDSAVNQMQQTVVKTLHEAQEAQGGLRNEIFDRLTQEKAEDRAALADLKDSILARLTTPPGQASAAPVPAPALPPSTVAVAAPPPGDEAAPAPAADAAPGLQETADAPISE